MPLRKCVAGAMFLGWIVPVLCSGDIHAQQASAPADGAVKTLHVTSRLVEVSAVVTEKNGEPRAGLTKDDFVFKQDGKEQPIRYFSQGDELPLTFVVMIDTSGSQLTFLSDEERACDVFFETVLGRPQDRAVLVEVNAKITARSALTNSPQDLHLALYGLNADRNAQIATRINDAIYAVSKDVLSKVHGRKAIILISDGSGNGNMVPYADAVAEAQRENVPVYAISYSAWSGLNMMPQGRSSGLDDVTRWSAVGDPGLANLKRWAADTGGHVYTIERGTTLKRIFENIAAELRSQYEIGYSLPPDTKQNTFHKLELKTKDKSLKVQARTGFYTNPGK